METQFEIPKKQNSDQPAAEYYYPHFTDPAARESCFYDGKTRNPALFDCFRS